MRKKRQKHVFASGEIPHLWAHRTQEDARNRQGNLYFTGDTIYSYGSHFPIARHVTNRIGDPIDPQRGNVRLRIVPDNSCSLEDLEGDCFNPRVNHDIPESRLQRDREQFIATVDREGVWGIIGEYFDGEVWQHADSCFGFVGEDWKTSGYDTDIMRAALNAAKDSRRCPSCGRPILKKSGVRC